MPALAEPARGFALSDFPDIAGVKDSDVVVPPGGDAKPIETAPPAAPEKPEETPTPETPERPEGEAPDEEKPAAATLNEAMDEQAASGKKEADEAAEAAKKQAELDAAAEKAKAEATTPEVKERDADLKAEWGPNTHANTRKKFDIVAGKAKEARDRAEAAIEKANAAEQRAIAAEEKAKGIEPPKELVEKLQTYEEKIRELDISQDPAIKQKYDAKIEANNKTIIDVLKAQAYHQTKIDKGNGVFEYVENPQAIPKLLADGLTLKTLKPMIDALEKVDLVEEADVIRQAIQQNRLIAKEKATEIDSWKADHSSRLLARERETKQQQEATAAEYRKQTDLQLNAELDELAKNFAYIKRPAGPAPTDPPAVAQAKNKAIADFDAAAKQIETAVKGLNVVDATPEKRAEVVGRINASAIQAIVLKNHVLPRVVKDMAAKDARIRELEARLGKIENAGKLSRAQSTSAGDAAPTGKPEPQTLADAFGSGPG